METMDLQDSLLLRIVYEKETRILKVHTIKKHVDYKCAFSYFMIVKKVFGCDY